MHGPGDGAAGQSAGFVLTGGESRRMGKDKALLPFESGVLAARIAGTVLRTVGSVRLVGDPERYGQLRFPVIPDLHPGFGPVGGIVTALSISSAELNLVVACDMPGVSVEFLASLLAAAAESTAQCAIPVTPDGRQHPLCAVYRRTAIVQMQRAVEADIHRLLTVIQTLSVHWLPVSTSGPLLNVNTPAEWESYLNAAN